MPRRLPPLNSLRAFEAAARHGSFVDAADELAVTPSAISQQVKTLEDWLGCTLFRRLPRGLAATPEARAYLPSLSEALDTMEAATKSVMQKPDSRQLTVTCLASFGAQWLTPRLHRFNERHPEIDVLLATFDRIVDLEREDVDIAIRYGIHDVPNHLIEELGYDELGIVCSPDLIEHPTHPVRELKDIAHHPLLHDSDARKVEQLSWEGFLKRLDLLGIVDPDPGPRFSDSHMMIQSCIAGRGIMIGRSLLIQDALEQGVLAAPFGMPFNSAPHRYRMAMLPDALENPKIAAFRQWIYDELGLEVPEY